MVVDLVLVRLAIDALRPQLDHRLLDEVENLGPATLENLCGLIWRQLAPALPTLASVRVWRESIGEGLPVPPNLPEQWVVDCNCVGNGHKALVYLGRYLYRGVIQERDIVRCADGLCVRGTPSWPASCSTSPASAPPPTCCARLQSPA